MRRPSLPLLGARHADAEWTRGTIPARYDLDRMLDGFETRAEAEERRRRAVAVLRRRGACDDALRLVDVLEGCRPPGAPCRSPACAVCTRRWRRFAVWQLLVLHERVERPAGVLTVVLEEVPAGGLAAVRVERLHDRLRRRAGRTPGRPVLLVGMVEAGWREYGGAWSLHVHLLAVGSRSRLTRGMRGAGGGARSAKWQPLRDALRQLSYLTKLAPYHRPVGADGRRAPARRLRVAQEAEYLLWRGRHRFNDLLHLRGLTVDARGRLTVLDERSLRRRRAGV